jgi:hypothetical protein
VYETDECNSQAMTVHEDDDEEELEVMGTLGAATGGDRGTCESLYLLKEKSLPDLIAMSQGLWARAADEMYPGLMFDLEGMNY